MIQRTATMAFKDISGKKLNLIVRDVKQDVQDADISALMDSVIAKKLIKTEAGDISEKVAAQVVTKETTKVTL